MATTSITATTVWKVALSGPADVNLQNVSRSATVQYSVAGATPSEGEGAILRPLEIHPVVIGEGESLYVRTDGTPALASLVAVDA